MLCRVVSVAALLILCSAYGAHSQIETRTPTACQKVHARAYYAYWAKRNKLQAGALDSTLSTEAYSAAMAALNGIWTPYLRAIAAVNDKNNNSADCETLAEAAIAKLNGSAP
jgi:hypothetical protein